MNHAHLVALEQKHAHLEEKIHEEDLHAACDELAIRRMKREKLRVKEEIVLLKEQE